MKRTFLWTVLAVSLSCWQGLRAETVQNYVEHFDTLDVSTPSFAPKYWGHHVSKSSNVMQYANPSEGGQAREYLEAGEQLKSFTGTFYPDYLVTPELTGDVRLYAKLTATDGYVKFYTVSEQVSDTEFSFSDTEYAVPDMPALTTDAWTEILLPDVPAGTRLGLLLNNAAIDEFSAASANLVAKQSLVITSVILSGDMDTYADDKGYVYNTFSLTLANTGDVHLSPDNEAYRLSFSLGDYSAATDSVGEYRLTDELHARRSHTIQVTVPMDITAAVLEQSYYVWVKEHVSGHTAQLKYQTAYGTSTYSGKFYPYRPIPVLYRKDAENTPYKEALQVGMIRSGETATLSFILKNDAAKAPMTVTDITLPKGYTIDKSSFVLAAGEQTELTLRFNATTPGDYSGNIVFSTEQAGDFVWGLNGYVANTSAWLADFETDTTFPDGFIAGANWSVTTLLAGLATEANAHSALQNSSTATELFTPLLQFTEGEPLVFFLATTGSSAALTVSYSADRNNWTTLATLSSYATDERYALPKDILEPGTYGSPSLWKQFVLQGIPAGKWYISFTAKNVYLDNINGGQALEVEKDLYITSQSFPAEGIVNTRLKASASVRNLGDALAADDYTATLWLGGEPVATAETYALGKNDAESFAFAYTPHEAGEFTAWIEFRSGDYAVRTAESLIRIAPETAEQIVQAGAEVTKTSSYPFTPSSYNAVQSETVYPQEVLEGLSAGDKIGSLTWYGYSYSYSRASSSQLPVRIYMENTTDAQPSGTEFRQQEEMTEVFSGTMVFASGTSQTAPYAKVAQVVLDQPFEYTGGSVRLTIAMEAGAGEGSSYTYITADDAFSNSTIYTSYSSVYVGRYMPVVRLGVIQEVSQLSGTITDKDTREPIAGAEVSLCAGEVLYRGVTDDNGQYTIEVIQTDKDYTLSVVADGWQDYVSSVTYRFSEGNLQQDVELEQRKVVVSGTVVREGLPCENALVELKADDTVEQTQTATDGTFSVAVFRERAYTCTVSQEGCESLSLQVQVGSEDLDLGELTLVATSVENTAAQGLTIMVTKGTIHVIADSRRLIRVTDTVGRTVFESLCEGAVDITGLPAGVYFVNDQKVLLP